MQYKTSQQTLNHLCISKPLMLIKSVKAISIFYVTGSKFSLLESKTTLVLQAMILICFLGVDGNSSSVQLLCL